MSSDLDEPLLLPATDNNSNNNDSEETQQEQVQQNSLNNNNMPPPRPRAFFMAAVTVAALPMFLFGFNTGVLNAPEAVIFPSHSRFSWSAAVSGFCVGGLFGANVSGSLADRWGRRTGLVTIFWINLVAGVLHSITPTMGGLILARVVVGIAGGASTVVTPMYLSEISPKDIRGSIGTLTQLACVVGILASILWELPFNSETKWRWIFVPLPLVSIVGIVLAPFCLVETPSWLLLHCDAGDDRRQEAHENLRKLRGLRDQEDDGIIEMMLHDEITASSQRPSTTSLEPVATDDPDNHPSSLEEQEEQQLDTPPQSSSQRVFSAYHSSFKSYVFDPRNRIPLISSILFPVAQQLSGINAVFYYSTALFRGVISNPETGTIIAFAVNAAATVGAVLLMDRLGRKTLLSLSAGGMFLCCILLTLSLEGSLPGLLTVVGVMLYICFFELGLGCIPFFLASEMIEPEFAGRVQSISMSCNWFSNFCVGMLFPYMDKYLGPYSFVPFAVVLLGTVLYAIFLLPETRGKTPAQVMQDLELRWGVTGHQPVPAVEEDSELIAQSDTEIV